MGMAPEARRGAPLLDIPPNYYEDLGARLGLEDAELADLQRHHLLYDRGPAGPGEGGGGMGGTFRHAYTLPFHDRFFFEVAERVGGYDGFGAANAGVRMAAQQRPQRR